MRKASALLFVAIVTLGMMLGFSTYTAKATSPGTVTINEPTGSEEVLFYEKITVNFDVDSNPGWIYHDSKISFGGVQIDYVTGGEGSSFEEDYFPETYVGVQTVTVKAYFVNYFLEEDTASDSAQFTINICSNNTDLTDLRIDKLHKAESGKKALYGNGVTICIVDDFLGCKTIANESFHMSLFRTCKNEINGNENRQYVDIEYYEWNSETDEFEEQWEPGVDTRQEKWQELYDEGAGNYDSIDDVHGTYCLATLRKIAPAAKIIFIATEDDRDVARESVYWLYDNYFDLEFDILSLSIEGFEVWNSDIENLAVFDVTVIAAAGNDGNIMTPLDYRTFPCTYEYAIGVTGVVDSSHGSSSDRWKIEN